MGRTKPRKTYRRRGRSYARSRMRTSRNSKRRRLTKTYRKRRVPKTHRKYRKRRSRMRGGAEEETAAPAPPVLPAPVAAAALARRQKRRPALILDTPPDERVVMKIELNEENLQALRDQATNIQTAFGQQSVKGNQRIDERFQIFYPGVTDSDVQELYETYYLQNRDTMELRRIKGMSRTDIQDELRSMGYSVGGNNEQIAVRLLEVRTARTFSELPAKQRARLVQSQKTVPEMKQYIVNKLTPEECISELPLLGRGVGGEVRGDAKAAYKLLSAKEISIIQYLMDAGDTIHFVDLRTSAPIVKDIDTEHLYTALSKHKSFMQVFDAFEPSVRIKCAIQLLAGVNALHGFEVIHCDLKPANILMEKYSDGSFQLKIADFGHSCQTSIPTHRLMVGTVLYTHPYTALSHRCGTSGEKLALGKISDLWTLFIILFEIFSVDRKEELGDFYRLDKHMGEVGFQAQSTAQGFTVPEYESYESIAKRFLDHEDIVPFKDFMKRSWVKMIDLKDYIFSEGDFKGKLKVMNKNYDSIFADFRSNVLPR